MKTRFCEKIKPKFHKEVVVREVADTITLDFITNLAMRTDDDLQLAKEVRRILGVEQSRRKLTIIKGKNFDYLPAKNKL